MTTEEMFTDPRPRLGSGSVVTCTACGTLVVDTESHMVMHFPRRYVLGIKPIDLYGPQGAMGSDDGGLYDVYDLPN